MYHTRMRACAQAHTHISLEWWWLSPTQRQLRFITSSEIPLPSKDELLSNQMGTRSKTAARVLIIPGPNASL